MVTHDRDEAYRMCGRLGVMEDGRLQAVKETKELFSDPGTRAAAVLTGCKNIAGAEKTGGQEVFVPAWNLSLVTEKPVRSGLKAVGIRAHSFDPEERANRFPVSILREMEEPFAWISEFRFAEQAPESPAVWWRYPKVSGRTAPPEALGVPPEDILLLYGE